MRSGLAVLALLSLQTSAAAAQDQDAQPPELPPPPEVQESELRVVVAGSEPFVVAQPNQPPTGMSLAVWAEVAAGLGRGYSVTRVANVAEALDKVHRGEADVAVGPISITEDRAKTVDFTQPYFEGSLAILAPAQTSAFSRLKPFMTRAFLGGLAILLVVLCGVGMLMWLAERRTNPESFPQSWREGLPEGLWMALVTMTTVGYGDKVPVSRAGRIVTGGWMLVSIVITSSLVAFVATAVTLSQIDKPAISKLSELRGEPVAVVDGTTSAELALDSGARLVDVGSLPDAVDAVVQGEAVAVLFDRPALRFYLNENPGLGLSLSQASYRPTGYGFALRDGSELRDPINAGILRLREQGTIERLATRWLGPANH